MKDNEIKKCKFCKFYKIGKAYITTCTNPESECYDGECIEQDKYESEHCDDKQEK